MAYIPLALESALRFVIAEEEAKRLWSLMSIDDHKLMMLFVVADERGKGVGSKLLEYGIAAHAISEFTVNGQSPQAIGPYKHRGAYGPQSLRHRRAGRSLPSPTDGTRPDWHSALRRI